MTHFIRCDYRRMGICASVYKINRSPFLPKQHTESVTGKIKHGDFFLLLYISEIFHN